MFNGEKGYLLKGYLNLKRIPTENVLIQMKELMKIIIRFMARNILCKFLSSSKHHFEGHEISDMKTIV